jgi:hypothetical protein
MSCNCIPKQKEPHIVKSPQCNVFYVCIPYSFQLPFYSYSVKDFYKTGKKKWYTITKFGIKKNFILFKIIKNIKNPIDCNGNSIPVRKYEIKL